VKRLVVGRAAADLVEGGIDEAQVPAGVLVGQGDNSGPQRSGRACPGSGHWAALYGAAALASSEAGSGEREPLGLSITRAIATAHAATIQARPQPGGGLAVDVTFPPPARPPARQPHAGRAVSA